MTPEEINQYMKGFERAIIRTIEIFSKHAKTYPFEMVHELEDFYQAVKYESEQMLDGQTTHIMET